MERTCPDCHATESEITNQGHRQLDGMGRPVVPDTMTSTYCPQACSCGAECFSMAKHDVLNGTDDTDYSAAQAQREVDRDP